MKECDLTDFYVAQTNKRYEGESFFYITEPRVTKISVGFWAAFVNCSFKSNLCSGIKLLRSVLLFNPLVTDTDLAQESVKSGGYPYLIEPPE